MLKTLINIFKVPELRNKVLFTIFLLAIYRIGFSVPLPGVEQETFQKLQEQQSQGDESAAGRIASYVSIFSGGNINQSTIFGLGLMPYISASIIFQLAATVIPSLEKLQKEGETGRRKIQEWTRYATVLLGLVQGSFWLRYIESQGLIAPYFTAPNGNPAVFWFMGLTILTTGTIFLMWLGEQIDEYGLGNGVSLLIMAGILAQLPGAIAIVVQQFDASTNATSGSIGTADVVFLICSFIAVTGFAILITQAQRRIPIQQAKYTRGQKVYGGQKQFLPLRLNHGGVMPVIFAQSLMLFPGVFLGWLQGWVNPTGASGGVGGFISWLNAKMFAGELLYVLLEIVMIYFFAYFWTTVQFQPKEMAKQLQDYGSFVPGIRPGKRTADYLESVMYRITFVGAGFLCVIAVLPTVIANAMEIPYVVASFLGGTGLLIVISVALDMVQRIEANLMMRNYGGFLSSEGKKGKRIRGRN
jgi:preprotein translocase subunit SecY